jgi:phosphoserine phosphatase
LSSNPKTSPAPGDTKVPLAVDLDGTLTRSDLMWESLAGLIKVRPLALFLTPFWLLRGRANLKHELAARFNFDPSSLPYNEQMLAYVRKEKLRGRRILLVTAADNALAQGVAVHLGLFDEVMASENGVNLRSEAKAAALVGRLGEHGFDYAGNSGADFPVWRHANGAILVEVPELMARRARAQFNVVMELPRACPAASLRWPGRCACISGPRTSSFSCRW